MIKMPKSHPHFTLIRTPAVPERYVTPERHLILERVMNVLDPVAGAFLKGMTQNNGGR